MKTVLTYGTFDLFHIGHVRLLRRLKELGDRLIVAVSSDEFNRLKGKKCLIPYEQRAEILSSVKYVDMVIPEHDWEQKVSDIVKHNVNIMAMGNDWAGEFDHLKAYCEVIYLPRTDGISTTDIKSLLTAFDEDKVQQLKNALDLLRNIAEDFE